MDYAPQTIQNKRDFEQSYLQAVLRDGTAETNIFGLRVMWGTVGEMVERLNWLQPDANAAKLFEKAFGPLIYVHISRKDKVAQAISLLKAEQSGLWHRAADGSERQRTAPAGPIRYDGHRIASLVAELERDDAAWNDFFSRHEIRPVRIEYESLDAHPRIEVQKILEALHIPPEIADDLRAQTFKLADDESKAWGERSRSEQRT